MVDAAVLGETMAIVLPSEEEARLSQWTARHIGVSADKAKLIVQEFRRFLYLQAVSSEPLGMPPVIEMLMRGSARERGDTGQTTALPPLLSLRHKTAYEATLVLYRQEFGALGHRRVWPTPRFLTLCLVLGRLVLAAFVGVVILIAIGLALELAALVLLGFLLLLIIGVYTFGMACFGPWGFTTADD